MMDSMSSMICRLSMCRRKGESSSTTSGTMETGSGTSPLTCRTATWSDSTKLNIFVNYRKRSLIVLIPMFLF